MSKRTVLLALGAIVALVVGWQVAAFANHTVSLTGSNFEIEDSADPDPTDRVLPPPPDGANLTVEHTTPPSLDWVNVNEARQGDKPTGQTDNSFVQGTKEDTAVPTIETGSIPNNKSDLLNFGVYTEKTASSGTFLHMFWHRVQEPTGTTNMDFEFNQNKCEQDVNDVDKDGNTTEPTPDSVCSANGITPVRKANDVLIQYDLASGGTRPELFLSRWVASGNKSQCQAANSTPCWGTRFNLSTANDATGSINNAAITDADNTPVDETDGLATGGTISPRTFGEASVDFDALVTGGGCTTFGSVYLKSRSSDSFTAALKDFIAPRATNVSNCGSVKIIKTDDANNNLDGAVFTVYKDVAPTGVSPGTEDTTQANTVGTCTTSAGTCTVSNLLAGSYWVVETTAPSGYDKATPDYQLVSITSDQQATVTFVNPRQKGTISIHKQDDGDPAASLAGAVFTLYHNNPPLTAPRGNAQEDPAVSPAVTCTTDASGNCSMQNVPVGEYWVVETTTPQGHQTAADQRATVTGGQTLSLTFTNPRLFKTIVLVCRESDNSLYSSSVTIDGVTKNSLDTHANETTLCQLGGASFGGQLKGNHTGSVVIPTSELPQP